MTAEIKVFWSCLTYLFTFFLLASATGTVSLESTTTITTAPPSTTNTTTATTIVTSTNKVAENDNDNDDDDMAITNQQPTAAKLVRYRRQPPITIIKHVIRSSKHSKPRRRIKRPKIRYGPPSYIYEDQSSYYKPHYTPSTPSDTSSFSLEDFPGLSLNTADFELPASSYEAQSMDLDFYGQSQEEDNSYQSIPNSHAPSLEYGVPEFVPSVEPTYSYKPLPRKPHQKYGVPVNLEYSSDFNVNQDYYSPPKDYSLYNSYQSESEPDHSQSSSGSQYHITNSGKHVPEDQYIPQSHSFQTTQQSTYNVEANKPDGYPIYDTKLPNSGFSQKYYPHKPVSPSFAQSHPLPTQPVSDIEITYSPSYEIDLATPSQTTGNFEQYDSKDSHIQPGNFAEPPEQHQPTSQYTPELDIQPAPAPRPDHDPSPGPGPVDYVPPSQDLPLNPHPKQPAYDFPKSSYEVPIYDPIPFEASTIEEQEYYPPNQYEPHPQQPPPPPPSPTSTTTSQKPQRNENQFNDRLPPPPTEQLPKHTHTSEADAITASTTKLRRNRKRQKRPLTNPTKHILDVPELKEAFEAARPTIYALHPTINDDTEVNASSYVEEKQQMTTKNSSKSSENYFSQEWNPMRIRTSQKSSLPQDASLPIAITTLIPTSNSSSKKTKPKQNHTHFKPRLRPLTTRPTTDPSSSPIVSIEKSQSKSYYDGTLAPSTLTMSNIYSSNLNKFKTPTHQPLQKLSPTRTPTPTQNPYNDATTFKRTTKSIFDTTHFKTPQNVWGGIGVQHKLHPSLVELNIPKNHKPY